MRVETNRLVQADTGFWIALYDKSDQHHDEAVKIMGQSALGRFLFPWPLHYELLRTRFVRRAGWVESFLSVIKQQRIQTVDDVPYREQALQSAMDWARNSKRSISLVDMVVRLVLSDPQHRIYELITFKSGDFSDVCRGRGIRLQPARLG